MKEKGEKFRTNKQTQTMVNTDGRKMTQVSNCKIDHELKVSIFQKSFRQQKRK